MHLERWRGDIIVILEGRGQQPFSSCQTENFKRPSIGIDVPTMANAVFGVNR